MSWLTTDQAAEYTGYHRNTLLPAARRGELRGFQGRRAWRFRRSDLDAWIEGRVRVGR